MIQSCTSFNIEGNFQLSRPMLRVMALASLIALAGCHRQANAPGDAPSNLKVDPGEGLVTVSWDQLPGLTYWIFFQAGSSVAARDPGVPLLFDVQSPRVVSGLTNGVQYAFVMNATDKDSPGGPSTPVVTAVPRLAGANWKSGAPLGTSPRNLNGVVFGAALNKIVAVGDAGNIFMSADLVTWTPMTSNTTYDLYNVAFPKDAFVATGAKGTLLTSPDAITWTAQSSNTLAALRGTTYGTGPAAGASAQYVVVGDSGTILTSPDATSWSPTTLPGLPNLRAIRFGTRFVAIGQEVVVGQGAAVAYSDDAINWSLSSVPGSPDLVSIIFTPAMYLAVGPSGANAVSR